MHRWLLSRQQICAGWAIVIFAGMIVSSVEMRAGSGEARRGRNRIGRSCAG